MYKVICVTDRHLVKGNFQTQIEKVLEQKPWALILREKDLDEERYAALAAEILPLCKKAGVLCLFRGHLKLAERMGLCTK